MNSIIVSTVTITGFICAIVFLFVKIKKPIKITAVSASLLITVIFGGTYCFFAVTSDDQTPSPKHTSNLAQTTPEMSMPINTEGRLGEKYLVNAISYQSFSDFEIVQLLEDGSDHILIDNTAQVKIDSDDNEIIVITNCDSILIAGSHNETIVIANCKQIILDKDAKNNDIRILESDQIPDSLGNNDIKVIPKDVVNEYVKLITEDQENRLLKFRQIDPDMDTEAPTILVVQAKAYKAFDAPRYCLKFTLFCLDNNNNEFSSINLDKDSLTFSNFSANIENIESSQNGIIQLVELSDVKFASNTSTFIIYVKGGALVDKSGNVNEEYEVSISVPNKWGYSTSA